MFCTKCGKPVDEGDSFCRYCGAPVGAPASRSTDIAPVYNRQKEIGEAVAAGQRALQSLRMAREELNHAKNWGIVDLVGGGLISSLAKRSKMNNAQNYMNQAKLDLRTFGDELDDVQDLQRLNIDTDDFLNFADWFFDGFVVDFMVQDKINKACAQVDDAIYRVENILKRLG